MAEGMKRGLPWTFSDVDLDEAVMNAARNRRSDSKERRHHILQEFVQNICDDENIKPYLNVDFLFRFLRGGKFNRERSLRRLRRYYHTKRSHPEIFRDFLPSCTLLAQSLNHISVLPYRAISDNSIILIYKVGKFDPNVATFEELVRLDYLVLESLLQNPVTQLCGVTLLIDFSGFSMIQTTQFTPQRLETIFELYHTYNTMRIVNVHVVNAFGIGKSFFDILHNRIMSRKMKDRVFIHSCEDNWASLHSHFPPEVLPEEFSGHLKSSELVCVYDLINHNEDYFHEQLV